MVAFPNGLSTLPRSVASVDIDNVAAQVGVAVPHLVEDRVAVDHLPGAAHEQQRNVELTLRQLDQDARSTDISMRSRML